MVGLGRGGRVLLEGAVGVRGGQFLRGVPDLLRQTGGAVCLPLLPHLLGESLDLLVVLLGEQVLVPEQRVQLLLVVVGEFLLVLQLVVVHLLVLAGAGAFGLDLGGESVHALGAEAAAVLAAGVVEGVGGVQFVAEGGVFEFEVAEFVEEAVLLLLVLGDDGFQLVVLERALPQLLLVAAGVQLVAVQLQT